MVLQRDRPNTFWGWTTPGSRVRVSVGGRRAEGVAGIDGKWTARLKPPKVGGPYTLLFEGPSRVELKDVLVGDVWLCAGQSNMEMGIGLVNGGPVDAAEADEPQIRLSMAPHQVAYSPVAVNPLEWKVCSPLTITQGGWAGFSAVGYHFGRELQRKLNVPIGLVQIAWGGTSAEAWTREAALRPLRDFEEGLNQVAAARGRTPVFGTYVEHWLADNEPGVREGWHRPEAADAGWKTMDLPGTVKPQGATWFRRVIDLPDGEGPAYLNLGKITETDTVWINGHLVGTGSFEWFTRRYPIPAGVLRPGANTIAIRLFNPRADGTFLSPKEDLSVELSGNRRFALGGAWKVRTGVETKDIKTPPREIQPYPTMPAVLANGMVTPLMPMAIRGAIWYQGEANSGRGYQYRTLLPAMISDWRKGFGQGDFPFYIVSLANYQARRPNPGDDHWAELREAQALTAARIPRSGLAVTIDVGDADDIHPKEKKTVGQRLALNALAKEYGLGVEYSGPVFRSQSSEGDCLRLRFTHAKRLAIKPVDGRSGFAIAGEDRKWQWATARIEGDSVVLSAPGVLRPVAARYAWEMNPVSTLTNGANLPAHPFRTDDWPMVSQGSK
jgi:sialate O-acetylesterase